MPTTRSIAIPKPEKIEEFRDLGDTTALDRTALAFGCENTVTVICVVTVLFAAIVI